MKSKPATEKLTGRALKRFYAEIFLDAIQSADGGEDLTGKDAFTFAYEKFQAEMGWQVSREGMQRSTKDWLQGLALNIPFNNHEILQLAQQTGHLPENPTESQEDKIVEDYWDFMAHTFLYLCSRSEKWFSKEWKS